MEKFEVSDFLAVNLSEEIKENETLVQGTSTFIPLVSAMMAMKKKRINFIGGFWENPEVSLRFPSTFCMNNYKNGGKFLGLSGFLDKLQKGKINLEFLRPAQVDRFGNMNNTVIGDYENPSIRLPGGMGVEDVIRFLKRAILYVPEHNKKVFVEKVDFVTAAGWDKGRGPEKIITNLCIFEFPKGKITLTAINPLFSIEEVKKETGFDFEVAGEVKEMKLPDEEDFEIMNEIDPLGLRNLEIKDRRERVLENLSK